ncbi:DNA-binding transcriptional MerR regulator [Amycolatopsis bartoniae]|nr:DNA-binding transcriptional MerR regulator [Amycolatopsis bartoniae]
MTASERTSAGHRRYTPDDLRRLYRVRALRSLGLSLEEVAAALAHPPDLRGLLTEQLAALEAQAVRLRHVIHHVGALLRRLDDGCPDARQFLETLEVMAMYENRASGRRPRRASCGRTTAPVSRGRCRGPPTACVPSCPMWTACALSERKP